MAEGTSSTGPQSRFMAWLKSGPVRKQPDSATNCPPAEDRRKPQKLSKSQLSSSSSSSSSNRNATIAAADGDSRSSAMAAALGLHHGRQSDLYLVGSLPTETHQIGIAISPVEGHQAPLALPDNPVATIRGESKRHSGLFNSSHSTCRPGQLPNRTNLISRHSRSNSFDCVGALHPTERKQSFHTARKLSLDARQRDTQRLRSLDGQALHDIAMARSEGRPQLQQVTPTTWKSCHPAQPSPSSPISRTQSDISLYLPLRRRSDVRPPGIATRAEPQNRSARSSFHSSLASSPVQSRHNSIHSNAPRSPIHAPPAPLSPPVEHSSPASQRAVTPCESEYKQLGGIKFGSLRITNGAPKPSPAPDADSETEAEGKSPHASSAVSFFDRAAAVPQKQSPIEENSASSLPFADVPKSPAAASDVSPETGSHGDLDQRAVPDFSAIELLNVRDDPSAKPSAEKIRQDLERKALKDLSRSDSGFVSSPSSEGSQRAMSKIDSGYGSNASLRSLRSLKSVMTRRSSEKLNTHNEERASPSKSQASQIPTRPAGRPLQPTKKANQAPPVSIQTRDTPTASRTLSLTSLTRGSSFHLPSLRPSKSREFLPSRSKSKSRGDTKEAKVRDQAPAAAAIPPLPSPKELPTNVSRDSTQPGSRRRGPPKARSSSSTTTNISQDMNTPVRPALRGATSKDTLMTIMSVGSTELLNGPHRQNVEEQASAGLAPSLPRMARRMSLRGAKQSLTHAANTLFPSGKSVDSKDEVNKTIDSSGLSPEIIHDNEARVFDDSFVHESMGNSAFDQAMAAPTEQQSTRYPHSRVARHISSSARSQIPDSSSTLLTVPESLRGRKSKSPPPVSMRTRSGQNLRAQMAQAAGSTTKADMMRRPSLPRFSSDGTSQIQSPTQVMGFTKNGVAYPTQARPINARPKSSNHGAQMVSQVAAMQSLASYTKQPGHPRRASEPMKPLVQPSTPSRNGYTGHGQAGRSFSNRSHKNAPQTHASAYGLQHDTLQSEPENCHMPKSPRGRQRAASMQSGGTYGEQPPFRVLHSYNSPAYRGVPIWG